MNSARDRLNYIQISLKPGTKTVYVVRLGRASAQAARGAAALLSLVARGAAQGLTVAEGESTRLLTEARRLTPAQVARQAYRRGNGQYDEVHRCYCCKGRVGVDYASDQRTDTVDSAGNSWGDCALVLCDSCCTGLAALPDADAYAVATGDRPIPWKRRGKRPASDLV